MTAQPSSSSDGSSLPPRHRPTLSTFSRETTESDLWDFDDEAETPKAPAKPSILVNPRATGREIPAQRERTLEEFREIQEPKGSKLPAGASDQIRFNVNKDLAKNRAATTAQEPSIPKDDIDDIEDWDHFPEIPPMEEAPAEVVATSIAPEIPPDPVTVVTAPPESPLELEPTGVPVDEVKDEAKDEFSPVARANVAPVSLRPHLGLSALERIGLVLLLLLLLAGGGAIAVISLKYLPTETKRARANDFPIKGNYLTIQSATNYWREPIAAGEDRDTFRRGTKLLPVLEITTRGGPAAVRVYFRNEDHGLVGDPVTKIVRGESSVRFPATAGFDEPGMDAAYRTGENKPWTIEVFEAPSESASGSDFKKLFEMNILTDRR